MDDPHSPFKIVNNSIINMGSYDALTRKTRARSAARAGEAKASKTYLKEAVPLFRRPSSRGGHFL